MRVFCLTVGRNEANRYLWPMLEHAKGIFDEVFFYDDRSDDETVTIAAGHMECAGSVRPDHVPSFAENEGMFRGAAWQSFEEVMVPQPGDWVCVVDCDEVLVSDDSAEPAAVRDTMEKVIRAAGGSTAVVLSIPEVFGYLPNGEPLVRLDGLWNNIHAPRLFAWRPGGQYAVGEVGVPAVPNYVMATRNWYSTEALYLMHYGYASPNDQLVKYERYKGRTGHSNAHVDSIVDSRQQLANWVLPYVPTMISRSYGWNP